MSAARSDPGARLLRALVADAAAAGCPVAPLGLDCRDWASATFTGVRCRIRLRAEASPQLTAWLAALPEAEFAIPGWIVADLAVDAAHLLVELTALLLHDD